MLSTLCCHEKKEKKTDRTKKDGTLMKKAVHVQEAIQTDGKIRAIAREYKVDRMTLTRYVKKFKSGEIGPQDNYTPNFNTKQACFNILLVQFKLNSNIADQN